MLVLRKKGEVPPGRYSYFQQETKTPFSGFSTLKALAAEVKKHRDSNNLPVGTAFLSELSDWVCRHMDDDTRGEWCIEEGQAAGRAPRLPQKHSATGFNGAKMWAELHRYALLETPTKQQRDQWLAVFAKRLPCKDCRPHWREACQHRPPPANTNPEAFFEWTVEIHSDVSESIGKSRMELAEARALWSS